MIEHNVVVVGGVEYKAVEPIERGCCNGCDLSDIKCLILSGVHCTKNKRNDKRDVIFKRHYRPKHNEIPIKVIEL